jgi:glycosyltransferase involved in cell wall biosynthesis
MFKILHLNASNFYGGPEKQIIEHLKRLNKNKYVGIVASFVENNKKKEILKKASQAGQINFEIPIRGALDTAAFKILKKELINRKINLLCTHGFKATVTGWWVARKLNIPQIVFSRGYTAENKKVAFYEWLERRILNKTEAIISVSEGQRKKLEKYGIQHSKHYVVHNAVDAGAQMPGNADFKAKFLAKNGIPVSALIAGAVGRFSPEKGHKILIEAMDQIKASAENLYLVLCGDGVCQEDLEKLTKKLILTDRIKFLGFRSDIDNIYRLMDFLVLPSFTEGLPNVVLEAFAHKKPVVATRVGGIPELVSDGENGLLVSPNDIDDLAKGIYCLYQSDKMRTEMGMMGLQTIKDNFSFELQNKKLEAIYDQALKIKQNSMHILSKETN